MALLKVAPGVFISAFKDSALITGLAEAHLTFVNDNSSSSDFLQQPSEVPKNCERLR